MRGRVSTVLGQQATQIDQLIVDGNQLFAALDARRDALASSLIAGIDDVSAQTLRPRRRQPQEFGPTLTKLNLVLDNLNGRNKQIEEASGACPLL